MTVSSWMNTWLAEYTGGIKENTLVSYRVQTEHNILPLLGAVKLSALQPHHIQKAVNTLFKRPEKPLSAKSVKNCYGVLHKALCAGKEHDSSSISHDSCLPYHYWDIYMENDTCFPGKRAYGVFSRQCFCKADSFL